MKCPACGGQGEGRRIAFCRCSHRWLVGATPKCIYSKGYYFPDPAFVAFARRFTERSLMSRCPPPARLLDIGCGAGEFIAVAQRSGYDTLGIDTSEAAVEICRSKGLDARVGDLDSVSGRFDVITMWDVLEHVADPTALLIRARESLNENGILLAKVPAFGSLSIRLSAAIPRLAGLLLGAPGHVQFFTRASLETLARNAGFVVRFDRLGDIRSRRGASLRHSLGGAVRSAIKRASGDANLLLFGHAATAFTTARLNTKASPSAPPERFSITILNEPAATPSTQ